MKIESILIGRTVLCDLCNEDYTNKLDIGGCLIGSYACCPVCTKKIKQQQDEENPFRPNKVCTEGVPFAVWVRQELRNGKPGVITFIS